MPKGEVTVESRTETPAEAKAPAVAIATVPWPGIDHLGLFAARLATLPNRSVPRIGLLLAQLGLLITVACFCISIAGMNIGLAIGLVGCLLAGAPLHRCATVWVLVGYLALLSLSILTLGSFKELISTASIPLGLLVGQIAFHPGMPGAARLRSWVAWLMTLSVIVGTCVAIGQFVIGRGSNRPFRIDPQGVSFFQSSGFFSLHLTQGAVMGLMFFLLGPVTAPFVGVRRWAGRIAAAVSVGLCGARAAMLGWVVAIGSAIAARGRRWMLIGGVASLVLLVLGFAIMRIAQPQRVDNLLAMRDGRWAIWQTTVQVIADHPWLGTGGSVEFRKAYLDVYPKVMPDTPNEFPKGAPHAHNTQLSLAAEHGIPLAVVWLVLLVTPVVVLWRFRSAQPTLFRTAVGMVTMAFVFGQFEKLDGESSRVLWTGLGMLLALSHAGRSDHIVGDQAAPTTPGHT